MKRLALLAVALALAACSAAPPATSPRVAYDAQALPAGPLGDEIRLGRAIVEDPHKYLPGNVTARMSCSACHIGAGTVARGGSFIGTYARFPQWNKRSHRVIALQDRLAECFLYSMNGRPPAYSSKAMIAMVAYIAWLSRDVPVLSKADPAQGFIEPLPSASPNAGRGAALYAQKCAACHQTNGAGVASAFPPLWGSDSFNSGAGMAHLDRMTGFVHYNMPQNAPGSLSLADSYDISAYVLSHRRPKFAARGSVTFPPVPAKYF